MDQYRVISSNIDISISFSIIDFDRFVTPRNNQGVQHNHSAALVMPDEHSESQSINRISRNQSEPSSSRFLDDANSSCQNGQNTQGCTGCQSLRDELQRIKAELADSK